MSTILLPALLVSIVLLGIHSYFGIRIIRRGIIFTDLAIGQMAALGAAVSLFFFHGEFLYPLSLGWALFGALLVWTASRRAAHLEAVIGLIYALGIAGVFMLLSKSPHGMEEFQNLMAYDILFTGMDEVPATAVLYAILGIVIYVSEKKAPERVKDVLFFITFAVTVTSSVRLAGVLIVFAILLSPAYIALVLGESPLSVAFFNAHPLIAAWGIGIAINLGSIAISYRMDLPTGYTLVFFHALAAIIMAFVPLRKVTR
ncbi:MAG TPA: metal ABC transporter permease [Spirochaetota bacterium]|nr:metal ABC transporter permease [Spirochaetota bacterium]